MLLNFNIVYYIIEFIDYNFKFFVMMQQLDDNTIIPIR